MVRRGSDLAQEMALLDPPAIVCRVWHPSEDRDLDDDELELELELDLHLRGWRMCDCFSRYVPEGELEHVSERRLYAIAQSDFESALELLRDQVLPEHEEHVYNAVVRAAAREDQARESAVEPVIVFILPFRALRRPVSCVPRARGVLLGTVRRSTAGGHSPS